MLAHLDSSDNQKSEARPKTILYVIESYCKGLNLSIETLLEDIQPKVTEEYENEDRQKSTKKVRFLGVYRF